MILTSLLNCPICDGADFRPHLICIDHTVSHENFTLKTCSQCQFVFTDPRPENTALSNYYLSDNYISHTGGKNTFIDKLYLMARKMTLRWKRKLIESNSDGDNILDIGCGTGEFLKEMQTREWKISGVEPSSTARASAEKRTGTEIHQLLSDLPAAKTFSAITLWHVLEHLPDLNQSLQTLQYLLKESGTIFIAVPNLRSYDAQYYKSLWAGYDVPRHLWHFNKENMKALLEKNGFRLTNIVPMRLDSFYVSLLSESYKDPEKSKFLHLITASLVGFHSNRAGSKSREYSSHIYVARR